MSDITSLQLDIDLSQRRPLRDEAYVVLRRAIVNGDLKPGEHLNERALAKQLGLSRSPVREALRRLEQEGLIAFSRQRLVVQQLSLNKVEELYQIRQQLEVLVARLAAREAQPEGLARLESVLAQMADAIRQGQSEAASLQGVYFHDLLAEIAGNQRLAGLLTSINEEIHRFRALYVGARIRSQDALTEHQGILAAVAAHDEDLAAGLMSTHIGCALAHIQQFEYVD